MYVIISPYRMTVLQLRTAIKYLLVNSHKTYGRSLPLLEHAINTYWQLRSHNKKWLAVAGFWHDVGRAFPENVVNDPAEFLATFFDGVFCSATTEVIRLQSTISRMHFNMLTLEEVDSLQKNALYPDAKLLYQLADRPPVTSIDMSYALLQAISDSLDILV
jgi:hypothetical protein